MANELVGGTLLLTASGTADGNGEKLVAWNPSGNPCTDLFAQVVEKNPQGVAVGSSRLIRFRLFP